MDLIKLKFSKSFLLKNFKDCPEGEGIYFHYINDNGKYRIIYVGECLSFPLRQMEHYSYHDKFRYSLFEIENGELNIKYIPDYDSPENFHKLKEELKEKISITCGEFESKPFYSYKEVEGAIINYLYRSSETRKFLLNTRTNYLLFNTEILFEGLDIKLYGLPEKIVTPNRNL
jgi:hypothetical protein